MVCDDYATTFALIPAMMHRKEERKLNYRAVFSLNVDLKKIWISKILTASIYLSITAILHMLGVFVFQFFIGEQLTGNYAFTTLLFASVLLVITNIWQVPFCFFLAKKFGFIASIVVNAVLGLVVGILLADGSMWIYCPYSWGIIIDGTRYAYFTERCANRSIKSNDFKHILTCSLYFINMFVYIIDFHYCKMVF